MTNRQARREQSRSSRNLRGQRGRSQRPSSQQPKHSGGGGPGDFLSLPYLIGVGVVAVALAGILIFVAVSSGGGDEEYVAALEEMDASFPEDMADGLAVGDPDAPVTLTAYEDFTCPFCLRFTAENEPGIISDYVEEGLVRFEFQHYPLRGTEATNAAEAAQCAVQQDRFWDMHNKLFLEHAEEGNPSSGLYSTDALKGYASDIGLDTEAFNACMDSDETLEEINTQAQDARSLGIQRHPRIRHQRPAHDRRLAPGHGGLEPGPRCCHRRGPGRRRRRQWRRRQRR
ncbi:MAG: thioredoxin domain-containing protein [Dehalococcoidia bacterium]|nr:thioredoxin domain-containing protein [Dehalococcoidia bacterium]